EVDTLAIRENEECNTEQELTVFNGQNPEPNYLHLLPHYLSSRSESPLPENKEDQQKIRNAAISRLKSEVFHMIDDVEEKQSLTAYGDWDAKGLQRYAWHGRLDNMTQNIMQFMPNEDSNEYAIISIGERSCAAMPAAGDCWVAAGAENISVVGLELRACGITSFSEENRLNLTREGCLVGLTPTMLMIQDICHLYPHLKEVKGVKGKKMILRGKGESAIAMLYAALLLDDADADADIYGIILEDLPPSMTDTEYQIMGILKVADIVDAVSLLNPIPVVLIDQQGTGMDWYKAQRSFERTSAKLINAISLEQAFGKLMDKSEQ
ncbi:MAG: hypothetical protein ACYTFY_22545, partial [Planctomycetota bacterium]